MLRPFTRFIQFSAFMLGIAMGIWWLAQPRLTIMEVIVQLLFFALLTGGILWAAHRAVHQANVNLFTALILGSVMGKLILSLIFLFISTRTLLPDGRSFLVLFFTLYLGYTVYEVRALVRLSRTTSPG
ncbi:MAG TPA: hypothetical protein P5563_01445 [Saprospiraceae bacterium]|nr:hypothetical protein [Saprospiraceae bacterium]